MVVTVTIQLQPVAVVSALRCCTMDEASVKRTMIEAIQEGFIQENIREEVRATVTEAVNVAMD